MASSSRRAPKLTPDGFAQSMKPSEYRNSRSPLSRSSSSVTMSAFGNSPTAYPSVFSMLTVPSAFCRTGKGWPARTSFTFPVDRLDSGIGHGEERVGVVPQVEPRVQLLHHFRRGKHAEARRSRALSPPGSRRHRDAGRGTCAAPERRGTGTIPWPTTSSA